MKDFESFYIFTCIADKYVRQMICSKYENIKKFGLTVLKYVTEELTETQKIQNRRIRKGIIVKFQFSPDLIRLKIPQNTTEFSFMPSNHNIMEFVKLSLLHFKASTYNLK